MPPGLSGWEIHLLPPARRRASRQVVNLRRDEPGGIVAISLVVF